MSNFLEAAQAAARSNVCALLGLPAYVNDMIERVGFPAYNNPLVAIPNFWRNLLCDTPGPEPNPVPFAGGQCPGVIYDVFGTTTSETLTGTLPFTNNWSASAIVGPVSRRRIVQGTSDLAQIVGQNGQIVTVDSVNTEFRRFTSFEITSIVRQDGLPDDCGDPDPEYDELEPEDVTFDVDITFNNSSNVETTIEATIVYARAQVLAVGAIVIPFTLQLSPTVAFFGNVSLDGTVNIYPTPAGGDSAPKDPRKSPCDDIPFPDGEVPEDPTDSDKDPNGDRAGERVIKGVLVTVNSLAEIRASTITQDENPDIYAPSLGFVNFLVRVGRISAGWTPDLPVKNRRCLIQCPWDGGAIEVKGTPQPGVAWTLTPVFGYAGVPVEYVQ